MKVRRALLGDIPLIRSIAHATWPVAYAEILSPEQLAYMLDRMYSESALKDQFLLKEHSFLLVELDGTTIGFASYENHTGKEKNTRLHKLYVLPSAQGTGAGKTLLNNVLDAARTAGDQAVDLNVNRFNRSIGFYLKEGFQIVRDEVIDIGQGYVMDDHVMRRPLD